MAEQGNVTDLAAYRRNKALADERGRKAARHIEQGERAMREQRNKRLPPEGLPSRKQLCYLRALSAHTGIEIVDAWRGLAYQRRMVPKPHGWLTRYQAVVLTRWLKNQTGHEWNDALHDLYMAELARLETSPAVYVQWR